MFAAVEFVVPVRPVTQGSVTSFGAGRIVNEHAEKLKEYRKAVRLVAAPALARSGVRVPYEGPVRVDAHFLFAQRGVTSPELWVPKRRYDLDKLLRALFDALGGTTVVDGKTEIEGVIRDDSQIVVGTQLRWQVPPRVGCGVVVRIEGIDVDRYQPFFPHDVFGSVAA